MERFDLVVIGSGSGNSLVTRDWDDKRVAIIDSGPFGGTCLNVGCIPTKMFVYAADVAVSARSAGRYGIDACVSQVRWADIRERVFQRIDPISAAGLDYRRHGPNTAAYVGRASFIGDRRLRVDLNDGGQAELAGDQVVIASGSHAVIPAAVGDSGVPYHTSDTIMRIEELPRRLVILGGGYIACEFAHVFEALGVEVSVVVRGTRLLRHLDGAISGEMTRLAGPRWDLRLGRRATAVRRRGVETEVDLDDGTSVCADALLVATGRRPSTADLDAPTGGVRLRLDGRVEVDEFGRTSAPGVWSLGDVSSSHQLKHVANHEARVVAHNLVHPDDLRAFDHRFVPFAVFTRPQIATVGSTEEQLQAAGTPYVAHTQAYGDTAYGWAMEDRTGFCKVLADPGSGLLLGVHILGYQASMLIQPAIQAMSLGTDAHTTARGQYWIHPSLTEVLENALLGLPL